MLVNPMDESGESIQEKGMTLALLLLPKAAFWKYLAPVHRGVQETQCNGHTQHPVLPLLKMFPMTKAEKAPDSPPTPKRSLALCRARKGGRQMRPAVPVR